MKIVKPFWYRTFRSTKSVFSYPKEDTTRQLAKKYSGSLLEEIVVSADVAAILERGYTLYSLIENSEPAARTEGLFKVFADGNQVGDYSTITEANAAAKVFAKYHRVVLVVSNDAGGSCEVGVFGCGS